MSRYVLCSVGTSLLTNRNTPWGGRPPGSSAPLPDSAEARRWIEEAGPSAASAETNTLTQLGLDASDRLAFLHSATPEGRYCAARFAEYYEGRVAQVRRVEVGALGQGPRAFSEGLKVLVRRAEALVQQARSDGHTPVFAATGGFKAEVAFLNLLGALLGIEVYYIHEIQRRLVRLPVLPLEWNTAAILERSDFFEWLDTSPRTERELRDRMADSEDLATLLEQNDAGLWTLSPAGVLLYEAAKARAS